MPGKTRGELHSLPGDDPRLCTDGWDGRAQVGPAGEGSGVLLATDVGDGDCEGSVLLTYDTDTM